MQGPPVDDPLFHGSARAYFEVFLNYIRSSAWRDIARHWDEAARKIACLGGHHVSCGFASHQASVV